MIKVSLREGQSSEELVRIFKKKCQKEGIIRQCKERQSFEKRSDKRRRLSRIKLKKSRTSHRT